MYCMLLAVRQLVKKTEPLNVGDIAALEEKLERCRTQENNPLSDLYVLGTCESAVCVRIDYESNQKRCVEIQINHSNPQTH